MKSYKALNNQVFSSESYKIIPIRITDRYKIMKWRNEQIYHLRQASVLTKEDQDIYFEKIISTLFNLKFPSQILFSFFHESEFVGYGGLVHIDWKKRTTEISFLMNTDLESIFFEDYWKEFLALIEQVAFKELNFEKIFVYAYDVRKHLYTILVENNYKLTQTKKNNYVFNNKSIDALIYTKYSTL